MRVSGAQLASYRRVYKRNQNCLFREADITISDTRDLILRPGIESLMSRPYFLQDDITWCVRRAQQLPAWKSINYIISIDVLVIGTILFVVVIFVAYALTSFEERPLDIWTSMLIVFRALISFSSEFNPKRGMLRLFFIGGLFTIMVVTTTFLAFYYGLVMQPKHGKQIQNFDELTNRKFALAGDKNTKIYLEKENLVNKISKPNSNFPTDSYFFCCDN